MYVGNWSSRASGHLKVLARKLTFGDSSNQVAAQLPVVTANNVPIPDDDFLEVPARYPTLNTPFDVFRTLAQLAT